MPVSQKSVREQRRSRQRRRQWLTRILWGGGGLAVLVAGAWLAAQALRPGVGETVEASAAGLHVPEGTDPGEYSTDPPTSGVHFPGTFEAGFYDAERLATLPQFPVGYLVHNLEHGYVIFWYDCAGLAATACSELKSSIQATMDEFDGVKLIAFPWESIAEPVVLTSWGKILRLDAYDGGRAAAFVRANRNQAPEPNAP
jgi:hypothetical protein